MRFLGLLLSAGLCNPQISEQPLTVDMLDIIVKKFGSQAEIVRARIGAACCCGDIR